MSAADTRDAYVCYDLQSRALLTDVFVYLQFDSQLSGAGPYQYAWPPIGGLEFVDANGSFSVLVLRPRSDVLRGGPADMEGPAVQGVTVVPVQPISRVLWYVYPRS